MKLRLFKNTDTIQIFCMERRGQCYSVYYRPSLGEEAVGYADSKGIGLNTDQIKGREFIFFLPQVMVHEILHYLFLKYFEVNTIIHKIHMFTRGVLL